jgi:diguanylate cyclase (GGDEF)-like protein
LFGRLGGEEFAALLPHTALDEGLGVAERIRANFAATALNSPASTFNATVSIGAAMAFERGLIGPLMAADRALYRAKANGRNRTEHAGAGPAARAESASAAVPHRMAG